MRRDYTVKVEERRMVGRVFLLHKGTYLLCDSKGRDSGKDGGLEAACGKVRRSQGKKAETLRWEVQTPDCGRETSSCQILPQAFVLCT